jgi:hypothetical protein
VWLLALAAGVIGVYGAAVQNPDIYRLFAVALHEGRWFADTLAVLMCSDLYSLGGDPLSPNPVAMHFYSKWWFGLDAIGLSGADAAWLGLSLGAAWAVASVFWIRPDSWWSALVAWLVMVSPAFYLGFNRGNVDLLLLMMMLPLPWMLTTERAGWRWGAPVILALCTGLKYFPLLAWPGLWWSRGGRRAVAWLAGAGAVLIVITLCDVLPDYLGLAGRMPSPRGFLSFGGAAALGTLGVDSELAKPGAAGLFLAGMIAWAFWSPTIAAGRVDERTTGFMLGACVLAGCFVLTGNFIYRMVFAVFLLPWLFAAVKSEPARFTRVFAVSTLAVLVMFLWGDGLFGFYIKQTAAPGDMEYIVGMVAVCERTMAVVSWALVFALQGWLVALGKARLGELLQSERRS